MKKYRRTFALVISTLIFAVNAHAFTSIDSTSQIVYGNKKTEVFKVYGNCGMCEKTIEGSLEGLEGIIKADWDKETKMMQVTFDEKLITLNEIKKKIAAVGYDTEEFRATDEDYLSLHGCCQYERPEK